MASGKRHSSQRGFAYLTAIIAVAMVGIALAMTGEFWSKSRQRDKEQELLFIGDQFRTAIALYYLRTPGAFKRYPENLTDLTEDKRYLSVQRYLRRIHIDPMTGKPEWGLVRSPQGGIMGVYSLSEQAPQKRANFTGKDEKLSGAQRYADWKFVYSPPPAPGAPVLR
jgi:type II secretory pathway pseudopilin PulG